MLRPITTGQFEKDLKNSVKRGLDMNKIKTVMQALINRDPLPARCRDHALVGNYKGRRECHILPDWLLIYKLDLDNSTIIFERTGSHADLF
jgi:mRNA interferase YafQ